MQATQSPLEERSFATLEEAFGALSQAEQDDAIRCGEYAKALFLQLCTSDIYPQDIQVNAMMSPDLADLVGAAGKYATIGMALVPPLYHTMRPDFTPEEIAVYQKHTQAGSKMITTLGRTAKDLKGMSLPLLGDVIATHCERWDGEGFPKAVKAETCNILGRTVAVAMTLNQLATHTRSERPIDAALKLLEQEAGTALDPEIVRVAQEAKPKLKRVFQKFIAQSQAIDPTDCMIRRRGTRPFSLWYRPIVGRVERRTVALEAQIMVRDQKAWFPYETALALLKKDNLLLDLGLYAITELCDTVRRLETCKIPVEYVALAVPLAFLNRRGAEKTVMQRLTLAQVAPSKLCLVLSKQDWDVATKTAKENCKKLTAQGVKVMLSGVMLDAITLQEVTDSGVTHLRFHGDMGKQMGHEDVAKAMTDLSKSATLLLDGLEKKTHLGYLKGCNISATTGILSGEYQSEDDMIAMELAGE